MDEFSNNNEEIKEEPAIEENIAEEAPQESFKNAFVPPLNSISYSEIEPMSDYKPMSRGLKIFSLVIAAVIVITGSCVAGYFAGKGGSKNKLSVKSSVNLSSAPTKTDEMTPAQVYEKVNKSVVGIIAYDSQANGSQASGIILSKDGYIITNDHIYSEIAAAKFKIYTHDGKEYDAKYVAGDKVSDLAVLKVDNAEFTPVEFANSDELYYGQNVVAIGRPSDATDNSSITDGIVSAINRRISSTSTQYASRLIQISCPINPGSSGGALVNMYGQVVGVTSSKLASSAYDNVGYAIPTTVVKRIVDELIAEGKVVSRAKLGITYTFVNSVTAELNGFESSGILVASVAEDSGLYNIAKEGDIITHINETAITDDSVVLDIIEEAVAGDTISVTFISDGKTKTVDVVLAANVSESSYSTEIKIENSEGSSSGGTFDFPFGE